MISQTMQKRHRAPIQYGILEPRQLLAGDVTAFVRDGVLLIVGDQLANQIQVSGRAGGDVLVTGLAETTVNGESTAATFANSFSNVTVALEQGNDELSVSNLNVSNHFSVFGRNGIDRVSIANSNAGYFHLAGGAGDDVFELENTRSSGSTYVYLGAGNDTAVATTVSTGRNFKVYGESGDDTVVVSSLSAERKFRLNMDNGSDFALITGNTNIRSSSKLRLGNGNDFISVQAQFDSSRLERRFRRRTTIDGGVGIDANSIASRQVDKLRGFEQAGNGNGNERLLDELFAKLIDAGIDPVPFGGESPEQQFVQVTLDQSLLEFTENSSPIVIAPILDVTASEGLEISSATIQIDGFVEGEDELLFEQTADISGDFDSSTGVLTLVGNASPASYRDALRSVRYQNTSDAPTVDERNLRFTVISSAQNVSGDANRTLQPTSVDDPLTLVLPDPFSIEPVDATIGDEVVFVAQASDLDDNFVYQLDLSESGIAPTQNQPAINATTGQFSWTPDQVGQFTIVVQAINDKSELASETLTVRVAAADTSSVELDLNQQPISFTENDAPTAIDVALSITGSTTQQLSSARVTIENNVANQDRLLFVDTGSISGSYDSNTGVLSLAGVGSLAEYQSALRTVRYSNESESPDASNRTLRMTLVTSEGVETSETRALRVTSVDDPLSLELPDEFQSGSPVDVNAGEELAFTAIGTDLDNGVTYGLALDNSGLPNSANQPVIDGVTGAFTWIPSQIGEFTIGVVANNDAGRTVQKEFVVVVSEVPGGVEEIAFNNLLPSYTSGAEIVFDVQIPSATNLGSYNIDLLLSSASGEAGVDYFFDVIDTTSAPSNYVFDSDANFLDAINIDSPSQHRITLTDFDLLGKNVVSSANGSIARVVVKTLSSFVGDLELSLDTNGLILDTPDVSPTPIDEFDTIVQNTNDRGTVTVTIVAPNPS